MIITLKEPVKKFKFLSQADADSLTDAERDTTYFAYTDVPPWALWLLSHYRIPDYFRAIDLSPMQKAVAQFLDACLDSIEQGIISVSFTSEESGPHVTVGGQTFFMTEMIRKGKGVKVNGR